MGSGECRVIGGREATCKPTKYSLSERLKRACHMREICAAAALQDPLQLGPLPDTAPRETDTDTDDGEWCVTQAGSRRLDRWLDTVVRFSGSLVVFFVIQATLLAWALLGIWFAGTMAWQMAMGNGQAIFSYVFDSLLMRQQLESHRESLVAAAQLRSRNISHARMVSALVDKYPGWEHALQHSMGTSRGTDHAEDVDLPAESRLGKAISSCSVWVGHLAAVALYWGAVFLWIGFGPANGWSSWWQLDMNSALSAFMVLTFSLLAIVRERHADYRRACLHAIYSADARLEKRLRSLTGDRKANEVIVIGARRVNIVQRGIQLYAQMVGALVGVVLLVCAIAVWLAVGAPMHFNSSWWLIIGTYTGLVGTIDGFVLRNVQMRLDDDEDVQFKAVEESDQAVLRVLQPRRRGSETPASTTNASVTERISAAINRVCGQELTVIAGLAFILALVIGASVMGWNEQGQLLCNLPPMVVESFFMQILITAHNLANGKRLRDLRALYSHRLKLARAVDCFEHLATAAGVGSLEQKTMAETDVRALLRLDVDRLVQQSAITEDSVSASNSTEASSECNGSEAGGRQVYRQHCDRDGKVK